MSGKQLSLVCQHLQAAWFCSQAPGLVASHLVYHAVTQFVRQAPSMSGRQPVCQAGTQGVLEPSLGLKMLDMAAWPLKKPNINRAAKSQTRQTMEEEKAWISSKDKIATRDCNGEVDQRAFCSFCCIVGVKIMDIIDLKELTLLKWIINHKLMGVECNRIQDGVKCIGDCSPIAQSRDKNKVSLLCNLCNFESKVIN